MIVTLIVVCEVGFWVLLAGGLSLRYLARMPRTGAAVLLLEPLLELLLLIVTAIDLKNGAGADWKHGLAAVYIGFTVAYGHYTIKWVDSHFAYRFAGGPKPVRLHGAARSRHEWKMWFRTVVMAAVAIGLLQLATWYVGDDGDTSTLGGWQSGAIKLVGIHALIALSYTIWPKKAPAVEAAAAGEERPRSLTKR